MCQRESIIIMLHLPRKLNTNETVHTVICQRDVRMLVSVHKLLSETSGSQTFSTDFTTRRSFFFYLPVDQICSLFIPCLTSSWIHSCPWMMTSVNWRSLCWEMAGYWTVLHWWGSQWASCGHFLKMTAALKKKKKTHTQEQLRVRFLDCGFL